MRRHPQISILPIVPKDQLVNERIGRQQQCPAKHLMLAGREHGRIIQLAIISQTGSRTAAR